MTHLKKFPTPLRGLFLTALCICVVSTAWAGEIYVKGVASHYGVGDGLHGNPLYCGGIFNAWGLSAAHRTLPCGTKLQVYLVDRNGHRKGKPVVVTVRDRGPAKWTGHVLDLSYGAANALGFAKVGTARIVGKVLE